MKKILYLILIFSLLVSQSFAVPPAYVADSIWRITKHASSAFDGATGSAHGDKDAANTYTIFTVTGDIVILSFWGVINTDLTEAGATATLEVGVPGRTVGLIAQINAVDLDDGNTWLASGTNVGVGSSVHTYHIMPINDGANIIETTATQDITAGQIDYYIIWTPVEPGASVVEAGTLSQV